MHHSISLRFPKFQQIVVASWLAALAGCQSHRALVGPAPRVSSASALAAQPEPPAKVIRISAGAEKPYTDHDGNIWFPDKGFKGGGTALRSGIVITGTQSPGIYLTERCCMNSFSYPVPNGNYEVKLHFAETYQGVTAPGMRVFSLDIDGVQINDLDIFAETGGRNRALIKSISVAVNDGRLDIKFTPAPDKDCSEINGIEIIPADETTRQLMSKFVPAARDVDARLPEMRASPKLPAEMAGDPATEPTGYPARFFPFIDFFGQYRHADWPGKTHGIEDLAKAREAEASDLAALPGPEGLDTYGGWKNGPALKATGFFRVQKYQGKWYLVDPEGRLFFSLGIDCIGMGEGTSIEGREGWFQDLPVGDTAFEEFFRGRRGRGFDFAGANLKRKYGADWRAITADLAHRRLRSWGCNTMGNWSDRQIYSLQRTPYVATLGTSGKFIEGSGVEGHWKKFHDVFDPSFKAGITERMQKEIGTTATDPWCIGYFVDNELDWADETTLALATLASPATQAAKLAFIDDLKTKYKDIDNLNKVWGTAHSSWEILLSDTVSPDPKKAHDDLLAFNTRIAETYFKTCRDCVKTAAPKHLYLGCRLKDPDWKNAVVTAAAARYCDAVGVNTYVKSPADFKLAANVDVPLILGEFHFGALDRGLFHPGIVEVKDQAARAETYKQFVGDALRHPAIIGCHWFQYRDESTTGRSDGENFQIGFVDVTDQPYAETIAACREVAYAMYAIRSGR